MSPSPRVVLASSREWVPGLAGLLTQRSGAHVLEVTRKEDLTPQALEAFAPDYVFFPHWSFIIPETIWSRWTCVIFHMTDVPFGRGGSPLQNLLVRGIHETKVTALQCSRELDAGPVFMKQPLSLHGSAEEIFIRATHLCLDMMAQMVALRPVPVVQSGDVTEFKRRKPTDSDLAPLAQSTEDLARVHDFIRMLDADGYPPAFLQVGSLRLEFSRSSLRRGHLQADVTITHTKKQNEGQP